MINVVEERFKITVYYPVVANPYGSLNMSDSLTSIPVGAKPITVVMEVITPLFLHYLGYSLLNQTIKDGWYSQLALASIRFRDFHSQNGFGS